MADTHQNPANTHCRKPRRRWARRLLAVLLVFGLGTASGFAIGAHKATAWIWHGINHHKVNPEHMARHVDRRVDKVLSRVNATAEQKSKVSTIIKAAITDISALNVDPKDVRAKFLALLRADTVEAAAFESLRAEQAGKIEQGTKRIVQAMVEAASVLTPQQRRDLTERWYRKS